MKTIVHILYLPTGKYLKFKNEYLIFDTTNKIGLVITLYTGVSLEIWEPSEGILALYILLLYDPDRFKAFIDENELQLPINRNDFQLTTHIEE